MEANWQGIARILIVIIYNQMVSYFNNITTFAMSSIWRIYSWPSSFAEWVSSLGSRLFTVVAWARRIIDHINCVVATVLWAVFAVCVVVAAAAMLLVHNLCCVLLLLFLLLFPFLMFIVFDSRGIFSSCLVFIIRRFLGL